MGQLKFAQLTTSLIRGKIKLDYTLNGQSAEYQISIPTGMSANIELKIPHDKAMLWVDGKASNKKALDGVFQLEQLASGNHLIELK
ncbi:MAG: hypothetical protein B7Y69_07335 [Sphingobacteriia bacterium 35-40-8]|nr:MAG: hypothetical protein B7Y69_07335 [Sphingobacteriia bacterium 35-40-8]